MWSKQNQWEYDNAEPDCYERECSKCTEKEQTIDLASMHLERIVAMLYSSDYLDKVKLENSLDELCYLLQVPTISGDIRINRSPEEIITPVPSWLNNLIYDNQNQLKQIAEKMGEPK